jgi:hypothetical protein
MSHIAKVPAQAIANMTTKGTGISSSIPKPLKNARATRANATPTIAQTIQDGKYEPRMLREGAPEQPLSEPRIDAAPHNLTGGAKRWRRPRSEKVTVTFITRQFHRFTHCQQSPLWGSGVAACNRWIASLECQKTPECDAVEIDPRCPRWREQPRLD